MFRRFRKIRQKRRSLNRHKELGPYANGVLYESANGTLIAPVGDLMIGKHLGFKGEWDMSEIDFLMQHIGAQQTVYFVGTHIGALLIPIAKGCKQVVGYEANPDTFELLKWNINLNEVNNASIFNVAIGDSSRNVEFYKNKVNTGGSKMKPMVDKFIYKFDSPQTIEVPMIGLSEHIRSNDLPLPEMIIMDIEGAEYFALKGMQEILPQIEVLYTEYVPNHLKDISAVLIKDFLDLIVPHFNRVQLINGKTSYDLSNGGANELIAHLSKLDTLENLFFAKG